VLSARAFDRIKRDVIPQAMEDKCFFDCEFRQLFLHSNRTGQGVYWLTFDEPGEGAQTIEALCAKDVLTRSTPEYHPRHLHRLIQINLSQVGGDPGGLKREPFATPRSRTRCCHLHSQNIYYGK
jgi:hypothetical protein